MPNRSMKLCFRILAGARPHFLLMSEVEVRKGTHVAPSKSPTVAEAADTWLKEVKAGNIERTTLRHYEQHVAFHIVP